MVLAPALSFADNCEKKSDGSLGQGCSLGDTPKPILDTNEHDAKSTKPHDHDEPAMVQPLKGYEIYPWREGKAWAFALMPGTNRLKQKAEIRAARLGDGEALLKKLATLREGEWVTLRGAPRELGDLWPRLRELAKTKKLELTASGGAHP